MATDNSSILSIKLQYEQDVVLARQRARQVGELLGLDTQDQVRLASAVSELARNAFQYAKEGRVEFGLRQRAEEKNRSLYVLVEDQGPGIKDIKGIWDGTYVSLTGKGKGLMGARKLMDDLEVVSTTPQGTKLILWKELPLKSRSFGPVEIGNIVQSLMSRGVLNPMDEIQRQNQELLNAMVLLRSRENALEDSNRELEETNRGVLALYAELDEKAEALKRANELKTRFLFYMSHEFRTPLNSILGMADLLTGRMDGDLSTEQERQVGFIRKAARDLYEMVNDLLDTARMEAGKIKIQPTPFTLSTLFSSIKGMFRPLHNNPQVELIFDLEGDVGLCTDEGKLAQILRNLLANALKFTEHGHIRVSGQEDPLGTLLIKVEDTGIGIAPSDLEAVFDDFTQVDSPLQQKLNGSGLGLPLSRKLAELLGGQIELQSEQGRGCVFTVSIPTHYDASLKEVDSVCMKERPQVLVIDDEEASRYLVRCALADLPLDVLEAKNGVEGLRMASHTTPSVIILDFELGDKNALQVIHELDLRSACHLIPIIIHTSQILSPENLHKLGSRPVAILSKQMASFADSKVQLQAALHAAHLSDAISSPGVNPR